MGAYQALPADGYRTAVKDQRDPVALNQFAELRYWWVVLVVTALAVAASLYATLGVSTTYTGRASLIVSSNGRSPDQDAVLV